MTTLHDLPGVRSSQRMGNQIVIEGDEDIRAQAIATTVASGADLLGATSENHTLEEIYLRYFAGAEESACVPSSGRNTDHFGRQCYVEQPAN